MAKATKKAAVRRAPNTPRQTAAQQLANERLFHSIDGDEIRVAHPDGTVVVVGPTPRALPKKMWRLAIRAGCQSNTSIKPAELPELTVADDAFTRKRRIREVIEEALQSDDSDERYADAFTAQDRPSLQWVSKAAGFGLSADELNAVWDEIQRDLPPDDEGDGEGAGDDEGMGGE